MTSMDAKLTDAYQDGFKDGAAAERCAILEWFTALQTELIHPETAEEVAAVRWRDITNRLAP